MNGTKKTILLKNHHKVISFLYANIIPIIVVSQALYGLPYFLKYVGYGFFDRYFARVDEFFIVAGLAAFAVNIFLKNKNAKILKIDLCLIVFALYLLFSGSVSKYFDVKRTFLGTFDIVKNLSLILVFRFVHIERSVIIKAVKHFTIIMAAAFLIGIMQQFLTFTGFYPVLSAKKSLIYTTPSFIGHTGFGLLSAFLFVILFFKPQKNRFEMLTMNLSVVGVILSTSRMAYIFLMLFLMLHFLKNKRIKIMALMFMFIISIIMLFGFWTTFYDEIILLIKQPDTLLRTHSLERGLKIFADHPVFGVGPGTYGAVVSFATNSPVYFDYKFSGFWYGFAKSFRSLDNFFPQLLAESGAVGVILFALFWLKTYKYLTARDNEFIWLGKALHYSLICIIPLFFGSGLNLQIVTFTLWCFIGMYMAYINKISAQISKH